MAGSIDIWHKRLGHINAGAIGRLSDHLGNNLSNKPAFCKPCVMGKMLIKPFTSSFPTASRPLYRIHTDIMGPFPVWSMSGYRYIITFIDDHTRFNKVYLMRNKSDALNCFKSFHTCSEKFLSSKGLKLSVLQSDRGGEDSSAEFMKYMDLFGIIPERTPAETPQQNGVAERFNRTLIEQIRTIMIAGNMPKFLWAEITFACSLLINISPPTKLDNSTPWKKWMDYSDTEGSYSNFNYKFLHTLGCEVLVKTQCASRTDKLSPKAVECVLVGYENGAKAYRLFHIATNKIIILQNVIFNEQSLPFKNNDHKLLNSDESPFLSDLDFFPTPHEDSPASNPISTGTDDTCPTNEPDIGCSTNPSPTLDQSPDTRIQTNIDIDRNHTESINMTPQPSQTRQVPNRYGNPVTFLTNDQSNEPSYTTAINGPDCESWIEAMQKEVASLTKYQMGTLVPRPPDTDVIGDMWRFEVKCDKNGDILKFKARWVAFGNHQIQGKHFDKTWASVGLSDTLCMLYSLAANMDLDIHQSDISNTFLQGNMNHDVYTQQIASFEDVNKPDHVILLDHSLYGNCQAHQQFNEMLDDTLKKFGFTNNDDDWSLYILQSGEDFLFTHMHVDNGLIFSNSKILTIKFQNYLQSVFNIKWIDEPTLHLGIKITRCHKTHFIHLSQKHYLQHVLDIFNMTH